MKNFIISLIVFSSFILANHLKAVEENSSKEIVADRDTALFALYHLGEAYPVLYQNQLQRDCVRAAFQGSKLPKACFTPDKDGEDKGLHAQLNFGKITCRSHASMSINRRCYPNENEKNSVLGARARNLEAALNLVGANGEGATGKYYTYLWNLNFVVDFANWQNGGSAFRLTASTLDIN